ncbi:N(4)-(beta-N-acetylglucosaminyl)-L-asparaginase [Adhaeribacter radiodurans]|uniref:N(4)-(Beta-N-acetylglucosaminyl)-L-asparaginase n=1 Tax=Adhaeribacter radiodurans TaxID=2745197 RepID=A0A7L7L6U4_9BACT|nr:N(4)-(beta-N-acetylglucosaminyl)-L-asparaginase [Adhaeribacter radiodurans]QMU28551.1 N(4)-(beta-N-acetylglucosaminyl)-L-asparaginase [Adhaeribacter radiodurans]
MSFLGRRKFIKASSLGMSLLAFDRSAFASFLPTSQPVPSAPIVISTWDFGIPANQAAWKILSNGGRALDAVEAGARIPEADLNNHSVGRAGYPDRDGYVTLDACIMDEQGNCGAVAAMENIDHPISVARLVMEKTPHVLLVGAGATQFAIENGFKKTKLLTPESEKAWREWLKEAKYKPTINVENKLYRPDKLPGNKFNHDTIGMLALDAKGNMSGACTTSGMAFKLHGRVGDSPIIGAGLYIDNEVGGATSTGVGEEVIRNVGSFLVVELMRQGYTPEAACKAAVQRIINKKPDKVKDLQVGFLALNKKGEYGAYAIQQGFSFAVCTAQKQDLLVQSKSSF